MALWKSLGHSLTMRMIQNGSEKAPIRLEISIQVNIERKKTKCRITWVGEPSNGNLASIGIDGIGQRHRP
jgi:hypothetical protein